MLSAYVPVEFLTVILLFYLFEIAIILTLTTDDLNASVIFVTIGKG